MHFITKTVSNPTPPIIIHPPPYHHTKNQRTNCPVTLTWQLVPGRERHFAPFTISNMYIDPGHGHITTWYKFWQYFKAFIIPNILYQFQEDPFFYDLIHVYSPRAVVDNPLRQNVDVNRKALSLCPFVASLKKKSLKSYFIHIFLMILYMYIAAGQGQTSPSGQNFDVSRKALSLCPFVASFKKKSLWSLILYVLFHVFIHVYSPRTGAENPLGSNFFIST